MLRENTY